MGILEGAIEVVGAAWFVSLLLYVVGTALYAAIFSPRPTDALPLPLRIFMLIAMAPKAVLAGALYVILITIPFGLIRLGRKVRYLLWHVK